VISDRDTAVGLGAAPASDAGGLWGWWRVAPPAARRALVAASFGWMLDAFDVMLFALVLASLMADLGMAKPVAGMLGSLTLLASAAGGLLFGVIADRQGRKRALMGSILLYSVFTAACGLARSVGQLAVCRVLLGIGMGGEWGSGATLVSETWPSAHRGKALGFMQSGWAIGYAAAAITTALVLPTYGWRAVFFVGVLPALFTLWIQKEVEEPAIWIKRQSAPVLGRRRAREMFQGNLLPLTISLTLMNAFTMFAAWAYILWIPAYLSLPVAEGGLGLGTYATSALVVAMQIGTWFGYVTFGFISDALGRKRTYVGYLLAAAVLILAYAQTRNVAALMLLGPLVAFFGTGYFSGFGAVTAEIYPTDIRATAQGLTYNIGRIASALAPFAVGSIAATHGFGAAFSIAALAFLLAAATWWWIPETRGKPLD
jgi:MFS family permease